MTRCQTMRFGLLGICKRSAKGVSASGGVIRVGVHRGQGWAEAWGPRPYAAVWAGSGVAAPNRVFHSRGMSSWTRSVGWVWMRMSTSRR